MSVQFNVYNYKYNGSKISEGGFTLTTPEGASMTMSVSNDYQSGYEDETKEVQFKKIKQLLKGEPSKTVIYCNRNGESEFNIDFTKDQFVLRGGEFGPSFGASVVLTCSYSKNKEQIDRFMLFLMCGL